MSGNAGYSPTPGYEEKMHFIGPISSPLWFGQKQDVPKLLTSDFYRVYGIWKRFNMGMGLPDRGTWVEHDDTLIDAVVQMETLYRVHFSADHAIIELLTALLKKGTKR